MLTSERVLFDYGCGHGEDVSILQSQGYAATGWDPAFQPDALRVSADVVNLGYVLNVIEHQAERARVLHDAWNLTRELLVVVGRLTNELPEIGGTEYADGQLTRLGTFQKYYSQHEIRTVIEETGLREYANSVGLSR